MEKIKGHTPEEAIAMIEKSILDLQNKMSDVLKENSAKHFTYLKGPAFLKYDELQKKKRNLENKLGGLQASLLYLINYISKHKL